VPRNVRHEEPGAYYHVCSRGNDGRSIYIDEFDRWIFLELFTVVTRKHGWVVLSYCLMTNHYHVVLQIPDGGLSAGMHVLNGEFSRRTNCRHDRTGHLFRNRFYGEPIESEGHLLAACRYTVLNPCRAGLTALPGEWRWSSYLASVGEINAPAFLAVGALHELFGTRPSHARAAYRRFVSDGHGLVSDTGFTSG